MEPDMNGYEGYDSPAAVAFATNKLQAFLDQFKADTGNLVVSAAPDWFDDMWGKDTLAIVIQGRANTVHVDVVDWAMKSSPAESAAEVTRVLEESISRQQLDDDQASLVRRLAAFVRAGEGGRDAMTRGFPQLGPDDAVHFMRIERLGETRSLLAVGATNGSVDIAYEAMPDGSVTFWPEADLAEALKEGGIPDSLPGHAPMAPRR